MDIKEQATAFMQALGKGDSETASTYLTPDFTVEGPTPEPLSKQEFLGLHAILARAFPDWSFNVSQAEIEGDQVKLTIEITGTHTGVLDLTPAGLPIPAIAPTGRPIRQPVEHPVLTVRNGKFSSMYLPVVAGGGLQGVLSQLGIAAHAA